MDAYKDHWYSGSEVICAEGGGKKEEEVEEEESEMLK